MDPEIFERLLPSLTTKITILKDLLLTMGLSHRQATLKVLSVLHFEKENSQIQSIAIDSQQFIKHFFKDLLKNSKNIKGLLINQVADLEAEINTIKNNEDQQCAQLADGDDKKSKKQKPKKKKLAEKRKQRARQQNNENVSKETQIFLKIDQDGIKQNLNQLQSMKNMLQDYLFLNSSLKNLMPNLSEYPQTIQFF